MNSYVTNQAVQAYASDLVELCTHALTLQTNLRTCNNSAKSIDFKSDGAIQAYREFIPKLNRILSGNGWKRNAKYVPVIIPALEGKTDTYSRYKTLHFHLALGNFDINRIDVDAFEKIIACWQSTEIGTSDIKLRKLVDGQESGWGGYISKEVWKNNLDCIVYDHIQRPAYLTGN